MYVKRLKVRGCMYVVDVCGLEWEGHIQYNNHQQLKSWSTGVWSMRNVFALCLALCTHVGPGHVLASYK